MRILTRWTSADLLTLPQGRGLRYEIIDGELYVTMHPSVTHQATCGALVAALGAWGLTTGLGLTVGAPGLLFPSGDEVIPDVVWISHDRLQGVLDPDGHFTRAPELVVEVLAPGLANQHRDRVVKLGLYGREGVQEYWLVAPQGQTVNVCRFEAEDLVEIVALFAAEGGTLTSPLLPGFSCPVQTLFRWP
ncbi:MAG: Uma2 family endonuclease [Gemmatimonadales bacterium]